jgi:hypothetical protein
VLVIPVNDEISEQSVALIISGSKLTAQTLAKGMQVFLEKTQEAGKKLLSPANMIGRGKQTVKQLTQQGAGVSSIEITDNNIKSFESIARKYGVDFALQKGISENQPKWLVFFKGRDADAITAAFKEFSAKQLIKSTEKPSVIETLKTLMEKVKAPVIDQTRNKNRGRDL